MKRIILFLGITFLFSCSDLKRPERIEEIQQLSVDLDEVEEISNNSDLDDILLKINQISEVENRIKENFSDDTLSLELIKKMDSYKTVRPALIFVLNASRTIDSSLEVRKMNLDNLLTDIQNSVGKRAKYDTYIANESKEIEELKSFVNYCDSTVRQSLETFNTLHPEIEKFSFELELNN